MNISQSPNSFSPHLEIRLLGHDLILGHIVRFLLASVSRFKTESERQEFFTTLHQSFERAAQLMVDSPESAELAVPHPVTGVPVPATEQLLHIGQQMITQLESFVASDHSS